MFRVSWKTILFIGAALLILGVLALWSMWNIGLWKQGEPKIKQAQEEEGVDAPASGKLQGIEYEFAPPSEESEEKGAVAEVPVNKSLKSIPDLSRPISDGLRPNERTEMERLVSELKKSPYNAALWSKLGLYRKESSDYEGARLAWEFALELQPENGGFAENLGVLYGYYLKDGLKSEEFFRAAIALEPQNIHLRLRLFELYRDVFEDKAGARAAVEDALKDNPGDEQLTALLKEL